MRPAHQDVDPVGVQLGEQAAVVGDGQHAEAVLVGGLLDPAAAGAQGVDVEAGVQLVEDGDLGQEDAELEGLVALLLAAGQVDVEGPGQEALVEADALGLDHHALPHVGGVAAGGGDRGREEVLQRHAGDLGRVLHGQEQPGLGPLPRGHGQDVLAVHGHRAARDLVARATHDHVGQGGLARPVGAHDGVDLAALHGQVEAAQDRLAVDAGLEARDHQLAHEEPPRARRRRRPGTG